MNSNHRRNFIKKFFSIAGISLLSGSTSLASEALQATKIVDFVTHFPEAMSLAEYKQQKKNFENKDKVVTLTSAFKSSGKMLNEKFSFRGNHSVWRVQFKSEAAFKEWMSLTEELESHHDRDRETAGFRLEIITVA